MAATHKPSVCPAWQPSTNPAFIPLGGCPQTQHLSRLAAARKPSTYPAWRLSTNPAFIPLGSRPQPQHLSRLSAARKPSVYPAWRLPTNPAFIPLDGRPQPQHSSRLAAPRTQHSSRLVMASSSVSSFCSVCMPPAFFFCKRDIRRIFRFYCPHRHEVGPCRRQYVTDNACARATTASWPSIRHRRFFLPLTPCSFCLRVPTYG